MRGQLAQRGKELFNGLRGEHGSGFVQDEQARAGQQGADDFHALHFAHAERVHGAARVKRQAVGGGHFANAALHLRQRHGFVQPQPHIFGHGERVKQAEVLKHHGHAQLARLLRAVNAHALAVKAHFARIGLDGAIDDLHQRAFARAVFTQHGMNFARLHGERDAVIGQNAGVLLGNALQLKARRGGHESERWAGKERGQAD